MEQVFFSAEIKAISRALTYIQYSHLQKFIVYSDSLSVLQAIDIQDCKTPLVADILQHIYEVIHKGKELVFCWVPSHFGILGNEEADKLAKQTLRNPTKCKC